MPDAIRDAMDTVSKLNKDAILDLLKTEGMGEAEVSDTPFLFFHGKQFALKDAVGQLRRYTPAKLADWFRAEGSAVVTKKNKQDHFCLGWGVSGHRHLEQIEQRTLIAIDCDGGSAPDPMLALLKDMGAAFVAHDSYSHGDGTNKWHAILFLDKPLTLTDPAQASADEFLRQYGYVIGALAELSGTVGYDSSVGTWNRLLFVCNRPSKSAPVRRVWHEDGLGVRWDKWLEILGYHQWKERFDAEKSAPKPRKAHVPLPSSNDAGIYADLTKGEKLYRAFDELGYTLGKSRGGRIRVKCPWHAEHTGGKDGDSSTVLFMDGGNDGQGTFHCSHSHCQGRRASAVWQWMRENHPEIVVKYLQRPRAHEPRMPEEWDNFLGDCGDPPPEEDSAQLPGVLAVVSGLKQGKGGIEKSLFNTVKILDEYPLWKGALTFSQFSGRTFWTRAISDGTTKMAAGADLTDRDLGQMRIWFSERVGFEPSKETMDEAATEVAHRHSRHEVREYLERCRDAWDGIPRLNDLGDYFGFVSRKPDNSLTNEAHMLRKWLLQAALRIKEPGCQADYVLVLQGPQGLRKSTALMTLFSPRWHTDSPIQVGNKDGLSILRGVWLVEDAEFKSIGRADNANSKGFITTRRDKYRPSYGRREEEHPRQCVFAVTINPAQFLSDDENRRYWIIPITGATKPYEILAQRDLIWGEVMAMLEEGELTYFDDAEEERMICGPNQNHALDSGGEVIDEYVNKFLIERLHGRKRREDEDEDRSVGIISALRQINNSGRLEPHFETAQRLRTFTSLDVCLFVTRAPEFAIRTGKKIAVALRRRGLIEFGSKKYAVPGTGRRQTSPQWRIPWRWVDEPELGELADAIEAKLFQDMRD